MQVIRIAVLAVGFALAASSAWSGQLDIENTWARATPGGATTGAAYVTIRSPTADQLVGAATPVAGKAELHKMEMSGMVMKMRPVAGIDIPAGRPVSLAPGGLHIMLVGLKKPLQAGQSFPLTLTFAKTGARTVNVSVEQVGAAGPAAMPAMQH
jgi:periplasmic copper chaperone A